MDIWSIWKEVVVLIILSHTVIAKPDIFEIFRPKKSNPQDLNEFLANVLKHKQDFSYIRQAAKQFEEKKKLMKNNYNGGANKVQPKLLHKRKFKVKKRHKSVNNIAKRKPFNNRWISNRDYDYGRNYLNRKKRARKRVKDKLYRFRRELNEGQQNILVQPRSDNGEIDVPGIKYLHRGIKGIAHKIQTSPVPVVKNVTKSADETETNKSQDNTFYVDINNTTSKIKQKKRDALDQISLNDQNSDDIFQNMIDNHEVDDEDLKIRSNVARTKDKVTNLLKKEEFDDINNKLYTNKLITTESTMNTFPEKSYSEKEVEDIQKSVSVLMEQNKPMTEQSGDLLNNDKYIGGHPKSLIKLNFNDDENKFFQTRRLKFVDEDTNYIEKNRIKKDLPSIFAMSDEDDYSEDNPYVVTTLVDINDSYIITHHLLPHSKPTECTTVVPSVITCPTEATTTELTYNTPLNLLHPTTMFIKQEVVDATSIIQQVNDEITEEPESDTDNLEKRERKIQFSEVKDFDDIIEQYRIRRSENDDIDDNMETKILKHKNRIFNQEPLLKKFRNNKMPFIRYSTLRKKRINNNNNNNNNKRRVSKISSITSENDLEDKNVENDFVTEDDLVADDNLATENSLVAGNNQGMDINNVRARQVYHKIKLIKTDCGHQKVKATTAKNCHTIPTTEDVGENVNEIKEELNIESNNTERPMLSIKVNPSTELNVPNEKCEKADGLADVINGRLVSKIVQNIFDELSKNPVLKTKFYSGLTDKKLHHVDVMKCNNQLNEINADINIESSLLNEITKVLKKLVVSQVKRISCKHLRQPLIDFLASITNTYYEMPVKPTPKVHYYNNKQEDYLFTHTKMFENEPEINSEDAQDLIDDLLELMAEYNNLDDESREFAAPVREYIEEHIELLRTTANCIEKDEYPRKISKTHKVERIKKPYINISLTDDETNNAIETPSEVIAEDNLIGELEGEPIADQNGLVEKQLESLGLGNKSQYGAHVDIDNIIKQQIAKENEDVVEKWSSANGVKPIDQETDDEDDVDIENVNAENIVSKVGGIKVEDEDNDVEYEDTGDADVDADVNNANAANVVGKVGGIKVEDDDNADNYDTEIEDENNIDIDNTDINTKLEVKREANPKYYQSAKYKKLLRANEAVRHKRETDRILGELYGRKKKRSLENSVQMRDDEFIDKINNDNFESPLVYSLD